MKDLVEKQTIGAVVKKADYMFTHLVRRSSNNGSFNRIEWQLLNFIKNKNKASERDVLKFLSFFDRKETIRNLIERFEMDGLIAMESGEIKITLKGIEVFEEVSQIQEKIKEKAFGDIAEADYATTIQTLEKIVDNLKEFMPDDLELNPLKETNYSHPAQSASSQGEDLRLIKQMVEKIEWGHNQKNAEAFASLFSADAVFVNAAGVRLQGRENIFLSAKRVMESFMANSYARYEISGIRFISKNVAQVDINQIPITSKGELLPDETAGKPTYILIKTESSNWEIIVGQNTLVLK